MTDLETLTALIRDFVAAGCPEAQAPRVIMLAYKVGKNDGMATVLADLARAASRNDRTVS